MPLDLSRLTSQPRSGGVGPTIVRDGAGKYAVRRAKASSNASLFDVTTGGAPVETITLDANGSGTFAATPVEGHAYVVDAVARLIGGTGAAADTIAPTITSPLTATIPENAAYQITLTANEAVTWFKRTGQDAALFTLSGATLALSARDFEAPTDADASNTYVCPLRATDAAGNVTDFAVTWTVSDVVEGAQTPPLVAGYGKPGQTLTVQNDATYSSPPSSITKQWVMGEPDGDPATFTEVVSTAATLTLNDTTHLGKRIARREIPAGGAPITSCGVVCTDLNFGSYFGYGISDSAQPIGVKFAQAYQELVGGRAFDFIHDGSGADTWGNAVSSSAGSVHGVWKAAFPGAHMVWNTPLCVTETAPFSGLTWRFNDDTGDDVQAKPLLYTISGSADAHFTSIANNLLTANYGTAGAVTIRPGHEAQGGWYPWVVFNANVVASATPLTVASAVTLNDALSINGTTITFSGGTTLASVITAINAETATTGVTASAPTTIGNNGDRIKLSQNPKTRDLVLANVTGTPLASLKLTAGTFQASFKNYIAAFRHVVDIFRARAVAAGKPNYFKFQWCPNKNELKCAPPLFYPGDAYVDEISVDIYNDHWNADTRYDPVGNFDKYMIGHGKAFVSGKANYAGLWFKEYAEAQGATPMAGRDANGAAKAHSWNEWGTGFRPSFAQPEGSGGDDGNYIWSTLKWQQDGAQKGYGGPWNSYAADYHTRAILSSIVPNSVRNNSPKGFSQWLGGNQSFTVEGATAAYLWDEQPNQIRAFVGWWGTEAAQRALGTPAVIPVPTITCPDITAAEGRNASFVLQFSSPLNDVVEIMTQTQAVSAVGGAAPVDGVWANGVDYANRNASRSYIQAGVTSHTINVPVAPDAATEGLETFKLILARPTTPSAPPNAYVPNYNLGTTEAVCTIYPGLSISDVSVIEEEPSGTAIFTVSIAHAVSYPFSVTVATRNGTAVAGADYVAKTQVLNFGVGETSKSFAVSLIDDAIQETAKIFYADLLAPTPGAIFDGIGQCIIAANDAASWATNMVGVFDATDDASFGTPKTGAQVAFGNQKNATDGLGLRKDGNNTFVTGNAPTRTEGLTGTGKAALVFIPGDRSSDTAIDFLIGGKDGAVSTLFDGADPSIFMLFSFKPSDAVTEFIGGAARAIDSSTTSATGGTQRIGLTRTAAKTLQWTMRFDGRSTAGVVAVNLGLAETNIAHIVGVRHRNGLTSAWHSVGGAPPTKVANEVAQVIPGGSQEFADLTPVLGSYLVVTGSIQAPIPGNAYAGEQRLICYGSGENFTDDAAIVSMINDRIAHDGNT